MSSEENAPGGPEDLIDLDAPSGELNTDPLPVEVDSDNLLDSELPVLEEKLKSSSCVSLLDCPTALLPKNLNPVDVEDILITLDDNPVSEIVDPTSDVACFVSDNSTCELRRSSSAVLLELGCVEEGSLKRSFSCDNLEALNVLRELDDVLNASLEPSADEQACNTVLLDLDEYLDGIEVDGSDVALPTTSEGASGFENDPRRSKNPSSSLSAARKSRPSVANLPCFRSLRKPPPSADLGAAGIACDTGSVRPCGTVTLEHRQGTESDSSAVPKSDNGGSSAWLRNSMRRLRHLPMPSDDGVPSASAGGEPGVVASSESARPVSAPSVLVANSAGAGRGSASRRSRRPRSLSSSESSFVSSVDTSPSCTPAPSLVHNGQGQNATGNTRR